MKKEYDFSGAKKGPIERILPGKTRITIRLDTEIIEWFRAKVEERGGGNYQTLVNDALKEHIRQYGQGRSGHVIIGFKHGTT